MPASNIERITKVALDRLEDILKTGSEGDMLVAAELVLNHARWAAAQPSTSWWIF